jgi:hypothetical protein
MPPVKQFHRVYVGKHPAQLESNKKRLGGFVTRVGSETIEAVTFAPGQYLGQAWECRHIEDPILLSNPELMREDHIAVFKLAEMELIGRDDGQARANYDAWEQADNDLRVLRRRVDLLEDKVALLQQPRKRGRPPKNQESQIPVSSDV